MFSVSRTRLYGAIAAVFVVATSATTASAVSLQIDHYSRAQTAQAQSALAAFQGGSQVQGVRTEGFEGLKAWDGRSGASNPTTAVGAFTSLGGRRGHGATAINGGTKLQVRNDDPWIWGRHNTSGTEGNWLDSNDTMGMQWDVGGLPKFNSLAFLLTDVADVGAKFSIKVGGVLFRDVIGAGGKLANGSVHLVRVLLPETVGQMQVKLFNDRLNDGFGIDGATVANVAPVPVPPAAALLLTGLAVIGGLRRRRARRSGAA